LLHIFLQHADEPNAVPDLVITGCNFGDRNEKRVGNRYPHLQRCAHFEREKAFDIAAAQADVASLAAKGYSARFPEHFNWYPNFQAGVLPSLFYHGSTSVQALANEYKAHCKGYGGPGSCPFPLLDIKHCLRISTASQNYRVGRR
jgi:hypothetical protein